MKSYRDSKKKFLVIDYDCRCGVKGRLARQPKKKWKIGPRCSTCNMFMPPDCWRTVYELLAVSGDVALELAKVRDNKKEEEGEV